MGAWSGKGRVPWGGKILFVVLVVGIGAAGSLKAKKMEKIEEYGKADRHQFGADKRTYLVSKLLLIPTLAAIGLKFLLLLPIFLSKIALLSVLNFFSSKLNLLLSAVIGVKNFLVTTKPTVPSYENTGTMDHVAEYKVVYNKPHRLPTYELLQEKVLRQPGILVSNYDDAKFKRSSFKKKWHQPPRFNEPESRRVANELDQRQKINYGDGGKYACYWLKDDHSVPKKSHVHDKNGFHRRKFKLNRIQPHQPHWVAQNFQQSFIDRYDPILPDIPIEEYNFSHTANKTHTPNETDRNTKW